MSEDVQALDLAAFARRVLEKADYGDVDGGDLQDIAVACGLLIPTAVTEPCGEDCACCEFGMPTTCYRVSAALAAVEADRDAQVREAFMAGFHYGCDYKEPPCGPPGIPSTPQKALAAYLATRQPKEPA